MSRINADVLGIGISLTCAVHCVVLPMLISVLPAMGIQLFSHEVIEYATIAAAAVAGIYSLRYGYRNHRKAGPAIIFIAGFKKLVKVCLYLAGGKDDNYNCGLRLLGTAPELISGIRR